MGRNEDSLSSIVELCERPVVHRPTRQIVVIELSQLQYAPRAVSVIRPAKKANRYKGRLETGALKDDLKLHYTRPFISSSINFSNFFRVSSLLIKHNLIKSLPSDLFSWE